MSQCQKTQRFITEAVDNRLGDTNKKFFEEHIQNCISCRNDYELESLTRDFVKNKLTRHTAPEAVVASIKEEIEKQASVNQRSIVFFAQYPLARAAVIALFVIGVAFGVYFFNASDIQNTVQAADVLEKSIENYGLFLAGSIRPQQIGQNADELQDYFKQRVDFPISLIQMEDCEWVGAVLSDYNGLPLAHVVYKLSGGIVYVYQANWNKVREGNKLSLSAGAVASLNNTGWYVNGSHEKYNVVMWLHDNQTICAAVSTMEKTELKELFTAD